MAEAYEQAEIEALLKESWRREIYPAVSEEVVNRLLELRESLTGLSGKELAQKLRGAAQKPPESSY